MKISQTVSYAVQATLQLASKEPGESVPCCRLATEGGLPERFLLQILRNLVIHGILGSTRGAEGGYRLERSPAEISLLDVIEAIEGPLAPGLPIRDGLPRDCRRKLECALGEVTEFTRRHLRAVTLAHLLPAIDGQMDN